MQCFAAWIYIDKKQLCIFRQVLIPKRKTTFITKSSNLDKLRITLKLYVNTGKTWQWFGKGISANVCVDFNAYQTYINIDILLDFGLVKVKNKRLTEKEFEGCPQWKIDSRLSPFEFNQTKQSSEPNFGLYFLNYYDSFKSY